MIKPKIEIHTKKALKKGREKKGISHLQSWGIAPVLELGNDNNDHGSIPFMLSQLQNPHQR